MFVFARSRIRAAAPPTRTSTRYGIDRVELLCFLFRMMLVLGTVAVALSSRGIH